MTRSLAALLLVALTSFAHAAGPTPIGPLTEFIRPLPAVDLVGDAAGTVDSTLVAWTYVICPCGQGDSVYARLIDSQNDRNAFSLGSGSNPRVATNGTDYLVAWSIRGSRFSHPPYDNVKAQLVTSRGELGTLRTLNTSISGGARAVAWNGTHWLVGYQSNEKALVAILDQSLDRFATVDVGPGTLVDLMQIGGGWWAVTHSEGVTAAIEVRANGSVGARFTVGTTDASEPIVASNGARALIFFQNGADIHVATFTATSGFSEPRTLLASRQLIDAAAWRSDVLLVHAEPATTIIRGSSVDMNGNLIETATLLETASGLIRLAEGRDGLLLLHSTSSDPQHSDLIDLFAYRPTSLAPLDPNTRQLVSQANIAYQGTPVIESTGAFAVALWSQTIDETGRQGMFSRVVDANGTPIGEPTLLPFDITFPYDFASAYDGRRITVVWSSTSALRSVVISEDGKTAGTPMTLGTGTHADVASGPSGTFAVWLGLDGTAMGTPVRADGSPEVPGGFAILPSLSGSQSAPRIASIAGGFVILWSEGGGVKSVVVSATGAVQSSSELSPNPASDIIVASGMNSVLAAWRTSAGSTLFAFGGAARPFELFDPHWGSDWAPVAIVALSADRYLVTIRRGDFLWTSTISMEGAFITGITPLRLLGSYPVTEAGVTAIDDHPIVLFAKDRLVYVASGATTTRQRAVRR